MSHAARLRAIERLTLALRCSGGCLRCCGASSRRPGRLTAEERSTELVNLLARAGLILVAHDANAGEPEVENGKKT